MAKEVYCFCRAGQRGTTSAFMIQCDMCDIWFHGKCVGISSHNEDEPWYCQSCLKSVVQCANPKCCIGVRKDKGSKYCSEKCAYDANKVRYERLFIPKWKQLEKNHSAGRFIRLQELDKLEEERDDVMRLIGRLKHEKEELVNDIQRIKGDAKELRKNNTALQKEDEEDADNDHDGQEETTTGDQFKVFCIICGLPQASERVFKHWSSCHRKQESNFNYTSDVPIRFRCPGVDDEPNLHCQRQDKKTKRYCMHIESACPQHSNWQFDEDEICGCPLNISQDLVMDGNYCLELKRDCSLHYNWDRFRLATKNMERIQAFMRLEALNDKINRTQASLNDTYGGVVGIMKMSTIDCKMNNGNAVGHDLDSEMLDVEQ